MTVKYLKELLNKFDDNARVVIDGLETDDEVMNIEAYDNETIKRSVVLLQSRAEFLDTADEELDCLKDELTDALESYEQEGYSECDTLSTLLEIGYKLDDFKHIDRYEWAKRVAEDYGLI